ncbi:hypothetical protein [Streptomyces nigrescens]|uniref:Uncharacterized protein n=1 Tax=Streptomyces nigrescens TaxID=1920 RepID=A0A640TEM4_STRNI|nr:hypothetical protein [Streptomyces libani]WAT94956.1 hypothetical protein STRLI_000628 [Streptomyces libani subsp. libani]GFE20105.1 hypothetical protein Sliba_05580 [Streptomyces libani subsp. libani]GGV85890.1 hypothetical protein GCM10010500_03110 [Streptomyces libani subsp. libani]
MSPNVPKTPPRQIRIGDAWYDFDAGAKALDTERAAVIRELIDWYIREPGAKLPPRPDRNVILEARRERAEEAERKAQPGS